MKTGLLILLCGALLQFAPGAEKKRRDPKPAPSGGVCFAKIVGECTACHYTPTVPYLCDENLVPLRPIHPEAQP